MGENIYGQRARNYIPYMPRSARPEAVHIIAQTFPWWQGLALSLGKRSPEQRKAILAMEMRVSRAKLAKKQGGRTGARKENREQGALGSMFSINLYGQTDDEQNCVKQPRTLRWTASR